MKRVWVVIALVMMTGGCNQQEAGTPAADGSLAGVGTIHRGVGPECPDTWHVATADGRMLWPVTDATFQVDGLKVRFAARPNPGAMSTCMAGTIVEFTSLQKRRG